jgi:hypothetical protein
VLDALLAGHRLGGRGAGQAADQDSSQQRGEQDERTASDCVGHALQ